MPADEPPDAERRLQLLHEAAAASILSRIDQVVADARDRILEDALVYQRQPPEEIADVTDLLYSNFRMLTRAMAGERVRRDQLSYVAEHVRRRVLRNIPLDAVIEAYRIGLNVFWEECTDEVASRGFPRDTAVALARKMSEAMDTLTTHAAAAYVREESRLRSVGEKAALDLINALLRGDVDPDRIEPYGAVKGLDPQGDVTVIVGRIGSGDGSLTSGLMHASATLVEHLATRRNSALLAVREQAIVAVVPAQPEEILTARLHSARRDLDAAAISLYCGLSAPCSGFEHVAGGFEQAALAVSLATDDFPVISLTTLPALRHLLTAATARTRGHLLRQAEPISRMRPAALTALIETVHGFADADMNITRAALAMHIHENTLRYRLRRISEQTGRDPHTFHGLVELLCLVEVLRESAAGNTAGSGDRTLRLH